MLIPRNFHLLESFCVLLFAVSVFLWKPGMYVSSGLITLYIIVRSLTDRGYWHQIWANKLTKISFVMFVFGLITATIGAEQFDDMAWMARKTLFLPVIVFFVFALTAERNRKLANAGLIAGFWIATLLTIHKYGWTIQFGGRVEGQWPQGTWDTLLGLFFTLMVVNLKYSALRGWSGFVSVATTLMVLLMLLSAGGRAPVIGSALSVAVYFFIFTYSKGRLFLVTTAGLLIATLALTTFNQQTRPIIDRFASITDTKTNASNWIRLQLWSIGIAQLSHEAKKDPIKMFFGGGAISYNPKQIEFFKTMPFDDADRARLKEYGYPSGDTHNTYIDNALRHGILWTLAMTLYLIWLCTKFRISQIRQHPGPFILLINLLAVGMFYTVVPHFITLFFILFVAMAGGSQLHTCITSKK